MDDTVCTSGFVASDNDLNVDRKVDLFQNNMELGLL